MNGVSALQTLADADLDAVTGGHGGKSTHGSTNGGILGNLNIDINVEPIVAIGNLIVGGNISTGNAANNASSGNISLGNSWLGLL